MNWKNLTFWCGKTGNKKRATFLATLPKNELNSDVAPFTSHVQTCYQPDLLQDRFDAGGKTHNIAIQLFLQQCCKTSCTSVCCPFFRTLGVIPVSGHPSPRDGGGEGEGKGIGICNCRSPARRLTTLEKRFKEAWGKKGCSRSTSASKVRVY